MLAWRPNSPGFVHVIKQWWVTGSGRKGGIFGCNNNSKKHYFNFLQCYTTQQKAPLHQTNKKNITPSVMTFVPFKLCWCFMNVQLVGSECDTTKPATFSSWDHQTLRIKSFSYSSIGVSQTANCTTDKRLLFLSGLLGCTGDLMKADAVGSSPSQWKAISHFFHEFFFCCRLVNQCPSCLCVILLIKDPMCSFG